MSKNKKLAFLFALSLVGIGSFLFFNRRSEGTAEMRAIYAHASYHAEVGKPRPLYKAVNNMFIGRVQRQGRTHRIMGEGSIPSTLFRVEVLQNIKGSLPRLVTVNQDGGYDDNEDAMVLLNRDSLLEQGKIYFFATRKGGDGNMRWHTLVPVYGNVRIDNEAKLVSLVERFEKIDAEERRFQQDK